MYHYESLPMQYTDDFSAVKIENSIGFCFVFFQCLCSKDRLWVHVRTASARLNIYCGYTLEPPRRCGSNEYLQYMFLIKNK